MLITFVVPIYNERDTIEALVERIQEHTGDHQSTILLIDDGSTDDSREIIHRLAEQSPSIEAIYFNHNRGKTAALAEGFARARGDVVFTLDSDLQDDPAEIPRFLAKLDEGYDLVCGWKQVRHDRWTRVLLSCLYNSLVSRLLNTQLHDVNCGFKAMRIDVAQGLELRADYHRLIPVLAARAGFRIAEIPVKHHPRRYGKSKYGLERYWKGLRDVCALWWHLRTTR